MASARGDALDWALALARAPGERHALRARPVPAGIEDVMHLAAGTHAATINKVAAHAGMLPSEVVDAARFYLREVLFFPDADAYRVLGLPAGAGDDQVKHHHRLLQQWLHPDRPTSDWDAAFAAHVNAAWSQLRTQARRDTYMSARAAAPGRGERVPERRRPGAARAPLLPVARAQPPEPAGSRWLRRAPVLALFAVCVVLGVLAIRHLERAPAAARGNSGDVARPRMIDAPGLDLHLPPATRATAPLAGDDATNSSLHALQGSAARPRMVSELRPSAALRQAPTFEASSLPVPIPVAAVPATQVVASLAAAGSHEAPLMRPPTPVIPSPGTSAEQMPAVPAKATARPAAAPAASTSPARVAQAQDTGQRLLAYVSGKGDGTPPIWANLASQAKAIRARAIVLGEGRVDVDVLEWRVGGNTASMQASVSPRDGAGHRLRADLVWRDPHWLVATLSLEQAP